MLALSEYETYIDSISKAKLNKILSIEMIVTSNISYEWVEVSKRNMTSVFIVHTNTTNNFNLQYHFFAINMCKYSDNKLIIESDMEKYMYDLNGC